MDDGTALIVKGDGERPPASHVFRRMVKIARKDGLLSLAGRMGRRARRLLWYTTCSTWYERDLSGPITGVSPVPDVSCDFLVDEKDRLISWLRERQAEFPWIYFEEEVVTALRHQHVFMTLSHGEQIIGYLKIGISSVYIHDFGQEIVLPSGAAFVYDTFVLPEFRGRRLAVFGLGRAMRYLRESGFDRMLCHIERWNVPSVRTFEQAGFRRRGTIRFTKIAGISFFLHNGRRALASLDTLLQRQKESP